MLTESEAQAKVKELIPDAVPKVWTRYKDLYLVRVEYPSEEEGNFDPFFSVDVNTGETQDFSITEDGDVSEIGDLKWNEIGDKK